MVTFSAWIAYLHEILICAHGLLLSLGWYRDVLPLDCAEKEPSIRTVYRILIIEGVRNLLNLKLPIKTWYQPCTSSLLTFTPDSVVLLISEGMRKR